MNGFFKYLIVSIAMCMAGFFPLHAHPFVPVPDAGKTTFAIVVDSATYANCRTAIDLYAQTLEGEGLRTLVLCEAWHSPDTLRSRLKRLHDEAALEGCVFVGDIPIAMITKAQHLTSAFKMDERKFPLYECSVPSDRFYDDFDLKFTPLDEPANGLLHYYAMAPDSPQYIGCDIYSARIKPQPSNGDPYEQISKYLQKVVREHRANNELDQFVSYTGHGSYSNSLTAWRSEQQTMNEQFGDRFSRTLSAKYLRYSMEPYMKYSLIRELRRKNLDLMVFHEHGDYYRQYLSGSPATEDEEGHIEQIRIYLHDLYRRNPNDAREAAEKWGFDETWYADADRPEVVAADSLLDLRLGIINEEIDSIRPNARMVIFDACYNGDFRHGDYIAGKYIFSDGDCCIAWANSVNVLQDKSAFDLLGLLGQGVRIGIWAKHINILESHISGDPTLFFHSPGGVGDILNRDDTVADCNYWLAMLEHAVPDVQSLALIRLYEEDYPGMGKLLLDKFLGSPYAVVRHTAFRLAESLNGPEFKKILMAAVHDSFEFIRRIAVTRMGRVGDEDFIPLLIDAYIDDHHSARVIFQISQSLECFDRDKVRAAIEKRFAQADFCNAENYKALLLECLDDETAPDGTPSDLYNITSSESGGWRKHYITYLKNRPLNQFVRQFTEILCDEQEDESVRVLMAESLAWFNLSCNKQLIIDACAQLLDKGGMSEELTREVRRAYSRLTSKK